MFYTFNQNNSGGAFDYDTNRGISHYVIVEADSVEDAVDRAETIGLYFDDSGDCSCCGDRWSDYLSEEYDADELPSIYGTVVDFSESATYGSDIGSYKWINGYEAFVHYKDGTVKGAYSK